MGRAGAARRDSNRKESESDLHVHGVASSGRMSCWGQMKAKDSVWLKVYKEVHPGQQPDGWGGVLPAGGMATGMPPAERTPSSVCPMGKSPRVRVCYSSRHKGEDISKTS